jgi:hypothetical protein
MTRAAALAAPAPFIVLRAAAGSGHERRPDRRMIPKNLSSIPIGMDTGFRQ